MQIMTAHIIDAYTQYFHSDFYFADLMHGIHNQHLRSVSSAPSVGSSTVHAAVSNSSQIHSVHRQ